MKSANFAHGVPGICIAVAMLAACSGSQPPIGAPGATAQGRAIVADAGRDGSWMLPEAKSGDLLYVVTSRAGIDILSYPGYKEVGTLWPGREDFGPITSNPINGNVLVNVGGTIYEYKHGGKQPIAQIHPNPSLGGDAVAYAFDPTTGNIAVSDQAGTPDGVVLFYQTPSGNPVVYTVPNMGYPGFLGYDNQGNLFVEGEPDSNNGPPVFAELPKGGSGFNDVTLNEQLDSMGTIQWDGSYITVASGATIYQLQVSGSSGTITGTTSLSGAWAGHPWFWIQGDTVIGDHVSANHKHNGRLLGLWHYPDGGSAYQTITGLSTSKQDWLSSEAVSVHGN